ncbi:MAG: hypothetical protein ABL995_05520 [Bryobacteraceae bacterium]
MNPQTGTSIALPSRKGLLIRVLVALVAALVIAFGFVLPAEYQIDPTGFGKATGLTKMGAGGVGATTAAHSYTEGFRTDRISLTLFPGMDYEYKVHMKEGEVLVYSWTSPGVWEYDFHGEPDKDPGNAVSYKAGNASESHGSLIAPFEGIHGWFWKNNTQEPMEIRLRMAGVYMPREDLTDPDEIEAEAAAQKVRDRAAAEKIKDEADRKAAREKMEREKAAKEKK